MKRCGKFILGAVVGAALGVLFAPKSGAETRAFIKEKAQAYMDNADVMTDNVKDKAVELYSTASDYAGDATVQLKERIEVARGRISDTVSAVKGEAPVAAPPAPGASSAPAANIPTDATPKA